LKRVPADQLRKECAFLKSIEQNYPPDPHSHFNYQAIIAQYCGIEALIHGEPAVKLLVDLKPENC